ncbi:MAG: hypothetical protein V1848_01775 [Candidatus Magasanikbacteria bacterium]
MMEKSTTNKILSTILSIPVIATVIMVMYMRPNLRFLGFDVILVTGTLLIVLFFAKLWKHEIERLETIFTKIQFDLNLRNTLSRHEREMLENYHILKSTQNSLQALKTYPNLLNNDLQRRKRHLQLQTVLNTFKLFGKGLLWSLRLIIPVPFDNRPSFLESIQICMEKPKFHILRFILFLWILALITITVTFFSLNS